MKCRVRESFADPFFFVRVLQLKISPRAVKIVGYSRFPGPDILRIRIVRNRQVRQKNKKAGEAA
ncbi:hypothetical protein VE23_20065 [Paenibacillus sp. D9]|nr:hypothetical protein VE23_20065 [Paenibacillus sp. D9]